MSDIDMDKNFYKENSERLDKVEIKLAYLEDFMNQIQQVAFEQAKTIEHLEKENRALVEKMHEVSENLEGDIPNRKPPHY